MNVFSMYSLRKLASMLPLAWLQNHDRVEQLFFSIKNEELFSNKLIIPSHMSLENFYILLFTIFFFFLENGFLCSVLNEKLLRIGA